MWMPRWWWCRRQIFQMHTLRRLICGLFIKNHHKNITSVINLLLKGLHPRHMVGEKGSDAWLPPPKPLRTRDMPEPRGTLVYFFDSKVLGYQLQLMPAVAIVFVTMPLIIVTLIKRWPTKQNPKVKSGSVVAAAADFENVIRWITFTTRCKSRGRVRGVRLMIRGHWSKAGIYLLWSILYLCMMK